MAVVTEANSKTLESVAVVVVVPGSVLAIPGQRSRLSASRARRIRTIEARMQAPSLFLSRDHNQRLQGGLEQLRFLRMEWKARMQAPSLFLSLFHVRP